MNYASFVSFVLAILGKSMRYYPLVGLYLYYILQKQKKQINRVYGQFKASCKARKAGLSYRIETYPDLVMEK